MSLHRTHSLALASLSVAIALAFTAPARADDRMPGGNWGQFCQQAHMDGHELRARCRNVRGQYEYVEANVESCRGNVSYDVNRTKFVCANGSNMGYSYGPGYGYQQYGPYTPNYSGGRNFPQGNWQQSCNNASMQDTVLRAQCQTVTGQPVYARIDASQCGRGVWNDNGRLRCQ